MALFEYKALNQSGKNEKGMVEADSLKTARSKLKKQGLMVTALQEKSAKNEALSGGGSSLFGGGVKSEDISMMIRQLASLVKANIPLVDALNAVVEQVENKRLKTILSQVRESVNEGISLSKAFSNHPKIFDAISINMVEAGENSGTLGLVLIKLAELKESNLRLRRKVIGGMTYPLLMALVAIGVLIGIFTIVIPKLQNIFKSTGKELPGMTQFLIDMSDFLASYWWALGLGAFLAVVLFLRWSATPTGHEKWDAIKLVMPVFGKLFRLIAVTRFAGTMSTLLAANVPILTAMAIARNLVGNKMIEKAIENARNNITEGQSIADPLRRSGEFPPLVIHMISIGEKTGELPQMLNNIAVTYEEQVSGAIDTMTGLLEPAMIIFMGITVGSIVISIVMPLMEMSNIGR